MRHCAGIVILICIALADVGGAAGQDANQASDHPATTQASILPGPFSTDLSLQSIKAVADAVAKYQFAHPATQPVRRRQWVEATFYAGLIPYAQTTGNQALLKGMWETAEENQWQLGPEPRFADDHCIGWAYTALYLVDPQPHRIAPLKERFDEIEKLPHNESLELKDRIVHREWAWCDALFMAPPTWTHLYRCTGDRKYLHLMNRLWWKASDYLYDKDEQLYYRDSRFFTRREENGQKIFWSRGNGWVVAGLARVLNDLPQDYPARARYVEQFKQMCERLLPLQREDGSWPAGLLDPQRWDAPETSGTGFFTYAFMWGINHGFLERDRHMPAVEKGWKLLASSVHPNGKLGWVQPVGASPAEVRADLTQSYGAGAMLLAASEIYRAVMLQGTPSIEFVADNPQNEVRINTAVQVSADRLFKGSPDGQIVVIERNSGKIVSKKQAKDVGTTLSFHADFVPGERKTFVVHVLGDSKAQFVAGDKPVEVTLDP